MIQTSTERLQQIEQERESIMFTAGFQTWMKELNVSRLHADSEPLFNARDMNQNYNFTKLKRKTRFSNLSSLFNFSL
jgi:hypothetical protein